MDHPASDNMKFGIFRGLSSIEKDGTSEGAYRGWETRRAGGAAPEMKPVAPEKLKQADEHAKKVGGHTGDANGVAYAITEEHPGKGSIDRLYDSFNDSMRFAANEAGKLRAVAEEHGNQRAADHFEVAHQMIENASSSFMDGDAETINESEIDDAIKNGMKALRGEASEPASTTEREALDDIQYRRDNPKKAEEKDALSNVIKIVMGDPAEIVDICDGEGCEVLRDLLLEVAQTVRKEDADVKECVAKKIPILIEEHPEWEQAQAVAVAFSMCRKNSEEKMLFKDGTTEGAIKGWETRRLGVGGLADHNDQGRVGQDNANAGDTALRAAYEATGRKEIVRHLMEAHQRFTDASKLMGLGGSGVARTYLDNAAKGASVLIRQVLEEKKDKIAAGDVTEMRSQVSSANSAFSQMQNEKTKYALPKGELGEGVLPQTRKIDEFENRRKHEFYGGNEIGLRNTEVKERLNSIGYGKVAEHKNGDATHSLWEHPDGRSVRIAYIQPSVLGPPSDQKLTIYEGSKRELEDNRTKMKREGFTGEFGRGHKAGKPAKGFQPSVESVVPLRIHGVKPKAVAPAPILHESEMPAPKPKPASGPGGYTLDAALAPIRAKDAAERAARAAARLAAKQPQETPPHLAEAPMNGNEIEKEGTSEGATLGWETRRGGSPAEERPKGDSSAFESKVEGAIKKLESLGDADRGSADHGQAIASASIALEGLMGKAWAAKNNEAAGYFSTASHALSSWRKGEGELSNVRELVQHGMRVLSAVKNIGKDGTSDGAKLGWETRRAGGAGASDDAENEKKYKEEQEKHAAYRRVAEEAHAGATRAFDASRVIGGEGGYTKANHEAAQKAHVQAAEGHRKAAEAADRKEDRRHHEDMAGEHDNYAEDHGEKAGEADKPVVRSPHDEKIHSMILAETSKTGKLNGRTVNRYSNPAAASALYLGAWSRAKEHKDGLAAGIREEFTDTRMRAKMLKLAEGGAAKDIDDDGDEMEQFREQVEATNLSTAAKSALMPQAEGRGLGGLFIPKNPKSFVSPNSPTNRPL